MDFRSFYLHFECCVLMYDSSAVIKVRDDMLACQAQSHEVAFEDTEKVSVPVRILRALLRLFAPLM
jgi:cardiolipin synthase